MKSTRNLFILGREGKNGARKGVGSAIRRGRANRGVVHIKK